MLKKIQHYIEYFTLRIIVFFIWLMPRKLAHKIGKVLAVFAYYFIPVRKKYVIDALTLSFPDKTLKEIKAITKKIYMNFAGTFIDIMFFPKMSDDKIKKLMFIEPEDEKIFKRIHENGQGCILMSA
ncbi:MAG: hypothetical protein FWF32_06465, partial [Endomicrobia bacterium]|nr:hypothetical protein [Endomicrobiia bacterium]